MPSSETTSGVVVKVGGSLYDLPDLGPRLRRWLADLETRSILLVPGGGALADSVRDLDAAHGLGEETSHWLALRALAVAAHFLAALVPGTVVVSHPDQWRSETIAVLDAHAFAAADDDLPRSWSVTSDSLAARAARLAGARRLVLLKSITIPPGVDWRNAAERGWVDAFFPEAIGDELEVAAVNFRE